MIRITPAVLAVTVLLTGCDYLPTPENTAKKAVRTTLIDPDSAKFTSIYKGAIDGDYCGSVNAKNRLGAYAGSSLFIYEHGDFGGHVTLVPEPLKERDFRELVAPSSGEFDGERFTEMYSKIKKGCSVGVEWERVCGSKPLQETPKLCEGIGTENYTRKLYQHFYGGSE